MSGVEEDIKTMCINTWLLHLSNAFKTRKCSTHLPAQVSCVQVHSLSTNQVHEL